MEISKLLQNIKNNLNRMNSKTQSTMEKYNNLFETNSIADNEKFDLEFNEHFKKILHNSIQFGRQLSSNQLSLKVEKTFGDKMDKWKVNCQIGSKSWQPTIEIGYITYSISPKKGGKKVNVYFEYNEEINTYLRFYYSNSFKYNNESYMVNKYHMPISMSRLESKVFDFDSYLNDWLNTAVPTKLSRHIGMDESKIEFKLYSQFRSLHNRLLKDDIIQSGMRYKNFKENFKNAFMFNGDGIHNRLKSLPYESLCELIKYKQPYTPLKTISNFEYVEVERLNSAERLEHNYERQLENEFENQTEGMFKISKEEMLEILKSA